MNAVVRSVLVDQSTEKVKSFMHSQMQLRTAEAEVGIGCAEAIILPLGSDAKETEACEVMQKITDIRELKTLFILSDCKSAIDSMLQRPQNNDYHEVIFRVRISPQILEFHNVCVFLGWTPGHSSIIHNDAADSAAKARCLMYYRPMANRSVTECVFSETQCIYH